MSFVIKKRDSFFHPVVLREPKDGGGYEEQTINLEFKNLKDSELKELIKPKSSLFSSEQDSDKKFCREIIVGWRDVKSEDGELSFNSKNLEILLDRMKVASSIVDQYLKIIGGIVEKN